MLSNWFLSPWFLWGLPLVAGPVVIHLLNRQRYRVVEWAAMDFLRHAIRRSRRILRLQDLLLLLLRTACVLLFALAMARPYLMGSADSIHPDQPVHAVLILDNSLSMGYQRMDNTTLLDEAKNRAKEFIGKLPTGSRVSVLPACGSAHEFNRGAYSTPEDAVEALAAIEAVDRSLRVGDVIDLAKEVCDQVKSPPSKQIFLVSDQQQNNWPKEPLAAELKKLPGPLQVVQIAPQGKTENAWVSDFRIQDGIADLSTPAIFLATVRFEGETPRRDVQVTLAVNGVTVVTQTVDLQPGQAREVRFPPYQFDVAVQPGRAVFVPAEVSIPPDNLLADDKRFLAVPVVSSLPVVFVDAAGPDENPQRNRFGETFRLRRLLAPVTARGQTDPQLIQVRHVKIDRVDRDLLKDARLVVIAGVSKPQGQIRVLREYVEQGGNLMIAAGGDFDPVAWTDAAWDDGQGILPVPLKPNPVGGLPGASGGPLRPFQLDFSTLNHTYYQIEQTSRDELEELYRLPFFFKAVEADVSDDVVAALLKNAEGQIAKQRATLAETEKRLSVLAAAESKGAASEADRRELARLQQARDEVQPHWLLWSGAEDGKPDDTLTPADLAERTRPQVAGRYTNQVPFLVQRDIGRGRVLFLSTGVFRDWNTLTSTNAALLFDRIFRGMLERTLPRRNITSTERLIVPVAADLRGARFALFDPANKETPVTVDALSADRCGVTLGNLGQRGFYRVEAAATKDTPQAVPGTQLLDPKPIIAVNGPAEESELKTLNQVDLSERIGSTGWDWVAQGEKIQMAGSPIVGQDMWRLFMLAVLACLLLELGMLAWPMMARREGTS